MKNICVFIIITSLILGCGSDIDKDNFSFKEYLVNNDDLITELIDWDVDSAYIQFIGFPPEPNYKAYKDLAMDMKLSGVYPEEFFDKFDLSHPIIVVWALRKNTSNGNHFDDAGLSANEMVDYDDGVGLREARRRHDLGSYSNTTHIYSPFYLAVVDGEYVMLSKGYEEDRDCIDLFDDLILLDKNKKEQRIKASVQVGLYVKNKSIKMVAPDRLRALQMNDLVSISFEESGEDQSQILVEVDKKLNGVKYEVLNIKNEVLNSGSLYSDDYNYLDIRMVSNELFYIRIGDNFKKSFRKIEKTVFGDNWKGNDREKSKITISFNNKFQLQQITKNNENRSIIGEFKVNENGSELEIINGELKSHKFVIEGDSLNWFNDRGEYKMSFH